MRYLYLFCVLLSLVTYPLASQAQHLMPLNKPHPTGGGPGAINGGFYPRNPAWPAQHPSIVIAVDDVKASIKNVTDAGGKVLGEPMEIPGVGQYVSFTDTEGNRVSMLQPAPRN